MTACRAVRPSRRKCSTLSTMIPYGQVLQHLASARLVVDELAPQPQPRDRRAQIVAHGCQHAGAIIDQPLDALAHLIERARRGADFIGPAFRQRRDLAVWIEILRRPGEAAQRSRQRNAPPKRRAACTLMRRPIKVIVDRAQLGERRQRRKPRGDELAVRQSDGDGRPSAEAATARRLASAMTR